MASASRRHLLVGAALLTTLIAVSATRGLLAQRPSSGAGPWSGQAQCVVVAKLTDYHDEQTHTWRLTGAAPVPAPAGTAQMYYTWPATWRVQGSGRKTFPSPKPATAGREESERWMIANEMSAPLRITLIAGPTDRLRIAAEGQRGAPVGSIRVTDVSGRTRDGSVQPWPFPTIEDTATNTTISGSSTRTYPEGFGVGWGQPPKAITTATCTWSFTRGAVEQRSVDKPVETVSPVSSAAPPPATGGRGRAAGTGTIVTTPPPAGTVPPGAVVLPGGAAAVSSNGAELVAVAAPGGPPVNGLRVRATSVTQIALHWNCVQGSTGYEVFYAMNGGQSTKITPTPLSPNCVQDLAQVNPALLAAPGSTPVTTYSTGFSQGGAEPGNTYTYFVRALYANGGPADSPPATVRQLFPATPFSAWPSNPGQVTIHWSWPIDYWFYPYAGHVSISRKLAGESTFRQLATMPLSPNNMYNDDGVPVGSHQYLVEAVDGEKRPPVTVTTGVVSIWQAWTVNIVIVDLGFMGVWPGGTVRVLSAPAATGPFTDITAEGSLSNSHWEAVAQFGSNLHYKVVVSYPGGITYDAVARVAVPPASNIGLTAEDAGGGARLRWNCEADVARYELLRRVGGSGPFRPVGPYAFTVYPTPGRLGGPPTCSYNDTTVPLGNNVDYIVIGFSSKPRGDNPIRAARTSVFVRTVK